MHFDDVTHVTQLDLDELVVAGDWHGSKWQAIRVLDQLLRQNPLASDAIQLSRALRSQVRP